MIGSSRRPFGESAGLPSLHMPTSIPVSKSLPQSTWAWQSDDVRGSHGSENVPHMAHPCRIALASFISLSCFGVSQLFFKRLCRSRLYEVLGAVEQEKMCTSRVSSRTRFLVLAHQDPLLKQGI